MSHTITMVPMQIRAVSTTTAKTHSDRTNWAQRGKTTRGKAGRHDSSRNLKAPVILRERPYRIL
jgi:hypothetical protein